MSVSFIFVAPFSRMVPGTMFYKYLLTELTIIAIVNTFGIVRQLNFSHSGG